MIYAFGYIAYKADYILEMVMPILYCGIMYEH